MLRRLQDGFVFRAGYVPLRGNIESAGLTGASVP